MESSSYAAEAADFADSVFVEAVFVEAVDLAAAACVPLAAVFEAEDADFEATLVSATIFESFLADTVFPEDSDTEAFGLDFAVVFVSVVFFAAEDDAAFEAASKSDLVDFFVSSPISV